MTFRSSDLSPQQRDAAGLPVAATKKLKPYYDGYLFDSKTEAEYARHLAFEMADNRITKWWYSPLKLRIDDGCWYCPDFLVFSNAGDPKFELREVKGFMRDDARVKMKAVMPMIRQWGWGLVIVRKRNGGGWDYERWE